MTILYTAQHSVYPPRPQRVAYKRMDVNSYVVRKGGFFIRCPQACWSEE